VGAAAVALTLLPLTLIGAQLGVLQGAERFHRLAALYAIAGLGKVGGGVVGVVALGSVSGAMAGTALGSGLAAGVGHQLVTRRTGAPTGRRDTHATGAAREVVHAAYALGALFALSNVDVVLARHYLSAHDAGLYAVGAVVAKGAFWLPSFVPVVALPGLADPLRRRATAIRALAVVFVSAAMLTAGAFAFGPLVVRMIGGSAYTELGDRVWLFAAAGSLIAVAQVLLYSRLATEDRRAVAPMWAVVLLEGLVIAIWRHGSATEIVTVVVGAALSLAVAGALVEAAEHGMWLWLNPRSRWAATRD
jgi:O-antigen/teichoic acid export membrane protein